MINKLHLANPWSETWIRTARHKCVDHVLIFNQTQQYEIIIGRYWSLGGKPSRRRLRNVRGGLILPGVEGNLAKFDNDIHPLRPEQIVP